MASCQPAFLPSESGLAIYRLRSVIYTDGSATDAVRNGGGGVYATLPDGTTLERSFASGRRCTNYKAEREATKEALNMVKNKISKTSKVVILSDARSVLQTLQNTKDTELHTVRRKLLMAKVGELTLQWIPGHCNIEGNERADNLAKLGSGLDQEETTITYQEAKTMIRMAAGERWKKSHEDFNKKKMTFTHSAEKNKHPSLD
ncbi:ribonuclease H [Elysia marginata]|uniref:ribonuclease H n=1 Tax=Elysia marginata TaxID=1093978 RepID=A0AAV4F9W8_9GAST|nr:ribonuclease H [Elysia marginata]